MSAPMLSYSVEVKRSRWRKRALGVGVLAVLGVMGYLGRNVPARMVMLGRQAECLRYHRAAGPTMTYFAEDVPKGIEGDPDYHIGQGKDGKYFWYFYPKCLAEFEGMVPAIVPNPKHTPVYVGERVSKGGNRRLVVVRCVGRATPVPVDNSFPWAVIKPGTILSEPIPVTSSGTPALNASGFLRIEANAGQSDPADASHFTLDCTINGAPYAFDAWLTDDDRVVFTLR